MDLLLTEKIAFINGSSQAIGYAIAEFLAKEVKDIIFKKVNPDSLLERFIEPLEIAALATFLASPLSLAINGTAIRADAGSLHIV